MLKRTLRRIRGSRKNRSVTSGPAVGMLMTFRAEVMPGRETHERTFEVERVLTSGRIELQKDWSIGLTNETRAEVVPPERHINWSKSIFLGVFHLSALAALGFWSWPAVISAVLLYWVTGSLGVGMGYHRLLTHRGYKVPKVVEYFLVTCASISLQGGPIEWTATHRMHHAHTDRQGDPHTPREGRLWSHVGWIVAGTAQKHEQAVLERYVPDLLKDRFYVWLSRYYYVPLIALASVILAVGGWRVMIWSVF